MTELDASYNEESNCREMNIQDVCEGKHLQLGQPFLDVTSYQFQPILFDPREYLLAFQGGLLLVPIGSELFSPCCSLNNEGHKLEVPNKIEYIS